MSAESSNAQRAPVGLGSLNTVAAETHGSKRALATQVNRTASKRNRRSLFGAGKVRVSSDPEESKGHTQDWPNAIGFKYHEDVTSPVQLQISGEFPDYVRGTLYRIGPGGHEVETDTKGTYSIDHWFDGLSQIHRFQIVDSKTITYNSRHTCDSLIEQYRRQGGIGKLYSFAQGRDPCKSVFSKFMSVFKASDSVPITEKHPSKTNIGVTVSTDYPGLPSTSPAGGIKNLYAKTDSTGLQELHPETLEPIGLADQTFLHPHLKGPLSAAHAKTDPETGDVFNYNLDFGSETVYRVFKVWKGSGKAVLLATIRDAPAAYLHSFFLSKKYVILCIWNSHLAYRGAAILWKKNIMDAIAPYDGSKKARFYVIDRTANMDGVVGVYESDAFFAFHTINAWEVPRADGRGDDVMCEVTTFDSLDVLKKFYYHNLLGNPKKADDWSKQEPRMTRFKLEAVGTKVPQDPVKKMAGYSCGFKIEEAVRVYRSTSEQNFELATINPDFLCRPHRYTYGLNSLGASTLLESLIKYDSQTHTSIIWSKHGHTPGEPIFVANPHSTTGAEDDGVLLTVVLDGHKGKSYLLCLDARELKEVARAEMDSVVALGFHGKFVGATGPVIEGKGANDRGWAEW